MKCRTVCNHLMDLLDTHIGKTAHTNQIVAHLDACPRCAHEYEVAQKTIQAIQPAHRVKSSDKFKERVMNQVTISKLPIPESAPSSFSPSVSWKIGIAIATVLLLLIFLPLQHWYGHGGNGLALLNRAWAAESSLFDKHGIVYIRNEITGECSLNPELEGLGWLPLQSLDATGRFRLDQLQLPLGSGRSCKVVDEIWHESSTGRFSRVMWSEQKPIFANAFDGTTVYLLKKDLDGNPKIAVFPVTEGFQVPKDTARLLGIAAGFSSKIDDSMVLGIDSRVIDDCPMKIVKVGMPNPSGELKAFWLFHVRESDEIISEMEFVVDDHRLLRIRRVHKETVDSPGIQWDLAKLDIQGGNANEAPQARILHDLMVPDLSVQDMAESSDFETYVFASKPSWTDQPQIVRISLPHEPIQKMFFVGYRAKDGRHLVLAQMSNKEKKFLKLKKGLIYTGQNGFKVWSPKEDKWLTNILLNSARPIIQSQPSDDCSSLILESPKDTLLLLAINGRLTDDELHILIDNLVPAKGYTAK